MRFKIIILFLLRFINYNQPTNQLALIRRDYVEFALKADNLCYSKTSEVGTAVGSIRLPERCPVKSS